MILGIGFLLLVSLVLSAAMAALGTWATGLLPGAEVLVRILTFVVSFAVEMLLFAMIYKVLPDVKITWRDVWIGAVATALLFTLGKLLIGLYIAHSSVASTFGAAGSVVILLLWVYYSSQILFLGAEFTQVYASHYGSRIEPDEHAVPVVKETREVRDPKEWPPAARAKGKGNEKGTPERPLDNPKNTPQGSGRRTGS
jgi:membrane protein